MRALRPGVLLLLIGVFVASTGLMALAWVKPGFGLENAESHWPALITVHVTAGYLLVAYAPVLVGWRTGVRWLEIVGWVGLAVFICVIATHADGFSTQDSAEPMASLRNHAREGATLLPRLLFLLALLVWVKGMWRHGLLLTAPLSLSFLGLLVTVAIYMRNDGALPPDLTNTQVANALPHASLFVPMLLTLPVFLIKRAARPNLVLSAWTGVAALTFLIAAGLLWIFGLQGMPKGLGPAAEAHANTARDFGLLALATLGLWVAALWSHAKASPPPDR